jgi:hypothetical protein
MFDNNIHFTHIICGPAMTAHGSLDPINKKSSSLPTLFLKAAKRVVQSFLVCVLKGFKTAAASSQQHLLLFTFIFFRLQYPILQLSTLHPPHHTLATHANPLLSG